MTLIENRFISYEDLLKFREETDDKVELLVFLTLERSVETYFFRNSQTLKIVAINGTCRVKEIYKVLEAHSIIPQNISMKLLKEENNKTTLEYILRTPFRKISMDQIIEDINEIDGIFSTEQAGESDRAFVPFLNRLFRRSKGPNKPSM